MADTRRTRARRLLCRTSRWLPVTAALCTLSSARAAPVEYALLAFSEYQVGCQQPCECPILSNDVVGSFLLEPAGSEDGFDLFDISSVHWIVALDPLGEGRVVQGSGKLRIGRAPATLQRLELNLSFSGGEAKRFDSGLVPLGAAFPDLAVAVAMNGFYCYDEVFLLFAVPDTAVTSNQVVSWGRIKSKFIATAD